MGRGLCGKCGVQYIEMYQGRCGAATRSLTQMVMQKGNKQRGGGKKEAFSAASAEIRNNTESSVIAECHTEAFEPYDAFDLRKRRKKGGEKKTKHPQANTSVWCSRLQTDHIIMSFFFFLTPAALVHLATAFLESRDESNADWEQRFKIILTKYYYYDNMMDAKV